MILGNITLPDDLYWSDEHHYTPVQSTLERSLTGVAMIVVQSIPNARPITLEADQTRAWITGGTLAALEALAAAPGAEYVWLHADGRQFTVRFRAHEPPVIEADPILFAAPLDETDKFRVKIKLMVA